MTPLVENLYGQRVIIRDELCVTSELVQYRFPKSKKKRIRRKWSKRRQNFKMQDEHKAWVIGNTIYVSMEMHKDLIKNLRR